MKQYILFVLTVVVSLGLSTQTIFAGEKKSKTSDKKPSLLCRIPIVKNTPLCGDFNRSQAERLSPGVPKSSSRK